MKPAGSPPFLKTTLPQNKAVFSLIYFLNRHTKSLPVFKMHNSIFAFLYCHTMKTIHYKQQNFFCKLCCRDCILSIF